MSQQRFTEATPIFYSGGLRQLTGLDHSRFGISNALTYGAGSETQRYADISEEIAQRALDDIREVNRVNPDRPYDLTFDVDADFEDGWEDACRISAAYRAAALQSKNLQIKQEDWSLSDYANRLGTVYTREEGGHHGTDPYIGDIVTAQYGRRPMQVCGLAETVEDDEGNLSLKTDQWGEGSDTVDARVYMTQLAQQGYTHAVAKGIANKSGVWRIPVSTDLQENRRALDLALSQSDPWMVIRMAGSSAALLMQGFITMRYEYRLFVVDGEIVSGAACIEEFTPLELPSLDQAFDVRMREHRGYLGTSLSPEITLQAQRVQNYIAFVKNLLQELNIAPTCVIDVASDEHDQPLVVERNGITNAGLYASNPWLVAEKLVEARDRGYDNVVQYHPETLKAISTRDE